MARSGHRTGLLDDLHARGCDERERSFCWPVVLPKDWADHPPERLAVVYMEWCAECGAADWEMI